MVNAFIDSAVSYIEKLTLTGHSSPASFYVNVLSVNQRSYPCAIEGAKNMIKNRIDYEINQKKIGVVGWTDHAANLIRRELYRRNDEFWDNQARLQIENLESEIETREKEIGQLENIISWN